MNGPLQRFFSWVRHYLEGFHEGMGNLISHDCIRELFHTRTSIPLDTGRVFKREHCTQDFTAPPKKLWEGNVFSCVCHSYSTDGWLAGSWYPTGMLSCLRHVDRQNNIDKEKRIINNFRKMTETFTVIPHSASRK